MVAGSGPWVGYSTKQLLLPLDDFPWRWDIDNLRTPRFDATKQTPSSIVFPSGHTGRGDVIDSKRLSKMTDSVLDIPVSKEESFS